MGTSMGIVVPPLAELARVDRRPAPRLRPCVIARTADRRPDRRTPSVRAGEIAAPLRSSPPTYVDACTTLPFATTKTVRLHGAHPRCGLRTHHESVSPLSRTEPWGVPSLVIREKE